LFFKVAPHIVEDLGLNLYTDLPKVLVEFVANAHDADSPDCSITMNFDEVRAARQEVHSQWDKEKDTKKSDVIPLSNRTLPENVTITILDHGHGMTREDIRTKFLIAGRRRREEDGKSRTPKGRMVMGRKGLGKLAGFGVAYLVTIISKTKDGQFTKIVLDYAKIRGQDPSVGGVPIDELPISEDQDIGAQGTKVILSRLVYEPMKSRDETISYQIADHFEFIKPGEFKISLNDKKIEPKKRKFVYSYPAPTDQPFKLKDGKITSEGNEFSFRYKIRFTAPNEHLPGSHQGVRVYAHNRLASAPSLLELHTGIHGFRWTHYLDGIVQADFIDDDKFNDYIATDRQSLRWETGNLTELRTFLTEQMRLACDAYQKHRETTAEDEVKNDPFTQKIIKDADLPAQKRSWALRFAKILSTSAEQGLDDKEYKTYLPIIVEGIGQGTVLTALKALANERNPVLDKVKTELIELTENELGEFVRIAEGRIAGIHALEKLVKDKNFRAAKNEDKLLELFKKCPWLIDPTFFEFLTANQDEDSVFYGLQKELKIGDHAPKATKKSEDKKLRPDLTFLLGSASLNRLIIVELKAPNVPLDNEHLTQLENYIRRAEKWLSNRSDFKNISVSGYLIGSLPDLNSKNDMQELLMSKMKKSGPSEQWSVLDLTEVLARTKKAHKEMLDASKRALK
jgi:hypothetical protein